MFQTKVVEKIKTHVVCWLLSPEKSCRLWDNGEKYCREGQAKDGNITRRMRFEWWVVKATVTRSGYVILLFHYSSGCKNALQCFYVMRTLPVFLFCTTCFGHTYWQSIQKEKGHRRVFCLFGLYLIMGALNSRSWAWPARRHYTGSWKPKRGTASNDLAFRHIM